MYTVIFDDNQDCSYNWYVLDTEINKILEWFEKELKHELTGRSIYIFKKDNPIRKFCNTVSNHWVFESLIIVLIMVSTISLAFEHPLEDPHSDLMNKLGLID